MSMNSKRTLFAVSTLLVIAALGACGGGGDGGGGIAPGPAPQAGVIALPKTGQTTCYDTSVPPVAVACSTAGIPPGQDGASQTGVAEPSPRFTVDGTGACITDNLTGLMWTRNANLPAAAQTWQQALDYASSLTLCGFADWRLSNRKELRSLVNYNLANNLANNAATLNTLGFSNVQAAGYWSSSSYAGSPDFAWIVTMSVGGVYVSDKTGSRYVWPVRAGQ